MKIFPVSVLATIFRYALIGFSVVIMPVLSTRPLVAHPHVFIETKLVVELDDAGITGIHQYWTFDEYFSAWVIDEFDRDGDGAFSDEELKIVYQESFSNLKEHNYFTRILDGGREIPVTGVENFSVIIRNDRTVYSFFVPLGIKINREIREIIIAVYDESFYCQIFFPPAEIEFTGNRTAWGIDYSAREIPNFSYYFGMLVPTAVTLSISPS